MPDKPVCFIIMPITTPEHMVPSYHNDRDHFQHVLEVLFTPAVEAAGYQMIPPNVDGSEVIQAEIVERLINSDLVLCDISGFNPNVFVELGMRTALNKPVALVRDSLVEKLPL